MEIVDTQDIKIKQSIVLFEKERFCVKEIDKKGDYVKIEVELLESSNLYLKVYRKYLEQFKKNKIKKKIVKTKFIINDFHELDISDQQDVIDFVAGITGKFTIKEYEESEENIKKS